MSFDVLTSGGGSFSPTFASVQDTRYVAASSTVVGTRDGSFYRPYLTVQEAVDDFGDPVNEADYREIKTIVFLDDSVYNENVTLTTRKYVFVGNKIQIDGDITYQVDGALLYGASGLGANPEFSILNPVENTTTTFNNIKVELAPGGTPFPSVRRLSIFLIGCVANIVGASSGSIVVDDGTIGPDIGNCSIFMNQSVIYEADGQKTTYFLEDSSLIAFSNPIRLGWIQNMDNSILFGDIVQAFTGTILVQEWRNSSISSGCTLDFEQTLTNDLVIDSFTYQQILDNATVTTNTPNWTFSDAAEAILIQDSGSYFTSDDVEGALQEVGEYIEDGVSPNRIYIDSVVSVSGTRDGSFKRPYASLADAVASVSQPTTQAEYERTLQFICLEGSPETTDLDLPFYRNIIFSGVGKEINGDITWDVDNDLRFGSTEPPILEFNSEKGSEFFIVGDITIKKASGGAALTGSSRLQVVFSNSAGNFGTLYIADGINLGGASDDIGISASLRLLNNGAVQNVNGTKTLIDSSDLSIPGIFAGTLIVENISAYTSVFNVALIEIHDTGTPTITMLSSSFNSTGDLDIKNALNYSNYNVDSTTLSEINNNLTIIGQPFTPTPINDADTIKIADAGSYFTSDDVEGALQEVGSGELLSRGVAQSADPSDPPTDSYVIWQSDGTGTGDDGDILIKITDSNGTTETGTLVDFSTL